MKRQLSICICLSITLILFGIFFIKSQNEDNQKNLELDYSNTQTETNEKTQSITSSNEYKNYYFYAKNEDGHIFIYDIKSQTLYMETGIETDSLPLEIQENLEAGIYFENEEQLYSFLESYSS